MNSNKRLTKQKAEILLNEFKDFLKNEINDNDSITEIKNEIDTLNLLDSLYEKFSIHHRDMIESAYTE